MTIPCIKRSPLAAAACAILAAGCAQPEAPESQRQPESVYADAVFHNGRVYTVDDERSWVEAVAIRDGRFLATGSNEVMLGLAGPQTRRHDLSGAMAMPGLHDAHFHTMAIHRSLDCSPAPFTPVQLKETLEQCASQRVEGHPWLVINNLVLGESSAAVTNEIVNEVFPDFPVMIRDMSNHMRLVNDRGLQMAGIDATKPDPEGGRILRHPDTGKPTGVLAELSAMLLVDSLVPQYPEEALARAVASMVGELFSFGITSLQEAYILDPDLPSRLSEFDRTGRPMPYMLIHLGWSYAHDETRRQQEAMIRDRDRFETPHVSMTGIKVMLDGVPIPPAFTHVPLKEDGTVDETNLLVPRGVLAEKLIEWDNAGLKVKMHAAAEGSVRVGLDAIETVRATNGHSAIWHEIAHAGDVHEDDMPRFAELRTVAEVSPYFWHAGFFSGARSSYRFRTLQQAGAMITLGSDYPVVPSYNPFPPMQGVVTREGESVPVASAIDFYTRNPAEAMGRLDAMGTIEPGKIANMIVLDRNLLEIDPGDIGAAKVVLTVLDGDIVYSVQ